MNAVKIPTKQRYLSPQEYLKEIQRNQIHNNIEKVKFIPPKIGQAGFGQFLVQYKMAVVV